MTDVRPAGAEDLPAIQAIYGHWVTTGLTTFEETPPDLSEIERRWRDITEIGLPFLVGELDGLVRGFAFARPYRDRTAYRHTVENSVYIHHETTGRGLGRGLLLTLIEECGRLGYRQMVAVIGDSANTASIRLHQNCGFLPVGTLRGVGWKFGRAVDTVLMQRQLHPPDE